MPNYAYKDPVDLAYSANRRRLRTEGAILLDAVMNEALNEMTAQFNEALNEEKILEIGGTREEMLGFLRAAAQKQLGPAGAGAK